jgi:AbrB family looped-hinge helix DNA binding protein
MEYPVGAMVSQYRNLRGAAGMMKISDLIWYAPSRGACSPQVGCMGMLGLRRLVWRLWCYICYMSCTLLFCLVYFILVSHAHVIMPITGSQSAPVNTSACNPAVEDPMQTAVTKRGQTVIPALIRKRYHIEEGDSLVWIDDGTSIRVVPVARDPIRALRGRGRGELLVDRLLANRAEDRARD